MFSSKKSKLTRARQPSGTINESFRRNNVVVSRRQSEINSRQQSVTQRQMDKKRRESRHRLKLRVLAFLSLMVGLGLLWRMSITGVTLAVPNTSSLSDAEKVKYADTIEEEYQNNTLFGQSWLLDETAFEQAVIQKHPEISSLNSDITTPVSTKLISSIKFRKPVFTWKDASKTERYIDKQGMLFSINKDKSIDPQKLVHIEDESGAVLEAGSSVLTASLIQFIGQLHNELPTLYDNASIGRVVIPRSTREVQVQMIKSPYLIKFNSQREVGEVVSELKALLAYFKTENLTPKSYIDMRVVNKAFYK